MTKLAVFGLQKFKEAWEEGSAQGTSGGNSGGSRGIAPDGSGGDGGGAAPPKEKKPGMTGMTAKLGVAAWKRLTTEWEK